MADVIISTLVLISSVFKSSSHMLRVWEEARSRSEKELQGNRAAQDLVRDVLLVSRLASCERRHTHTPWHFHRRRGRALEPRSLPAWPSGRGVRNAGRDDGLKQAKWSVHQLGIRNTMTTIACRQERERDSKRVANCCLVCCTEADAEF